MHVQNIRRLADHPRFAHGNTCSDESVTVVSALGELIDQYLTHLSAGGAAPGTLRIRRSYLQRAADLGPLLELTAEQLEEWLARPSWKPETRKSARSSVVGFYRWATRRGLVDEDPAADLPAVFVPDAEPRPAPHDVVRATKRTARAGGDPRDQLLIALALEGGLRVHEIAKVHARDLEGEELRIVGKRGRSRVVPCPALVAIALRGRRGYLFPGQVDGHLSASYVGKRIKSLMPDGWTAHTLRHAAGTAVHEACGGDLLVTQRFLGHSKPETTRRYVRVNQDRLRQAARAAAASWSDAG